MAEMFNKNAKLLTLLSQFAEAGMVEKSWNAKAKEPQYKILPKGHAYLAWTEGGSHGFGAEVWENDTLTGFMRKAFAAGWDAKE